MAITRYASAFFVLALLATGCNLIAGLDDFHVTGGSGGAPSTSSSGTGGHSTSSSVSTGGGNTCGTCPEPEGTCRVATCVDGVCGQADAPDGTAAKVQIKGDCKKLVCKGGVPTPENDDTDPPEIPGDCKVHICNAGNVVVTFEPMSSPCGTGSASTVCDGNGNCFGCTKAEDCVDLGGCQKPTCNAGVCGSDPDPTDVVADTNECTEDLCTGPVPNHPNKMLGAVCSGSRACDGSGSCLGAACPDNPCPAGSFCVDGVCCNTACDQPCEACSKAAKGGVGLDGLCEPVAKGTNVSNECPAGQVCDGTVGATACKLGNGQACTDATACDSGFCADGVCCDTACNGVCQSCNAAATKGTCTNFAGGTDPDNECAGSVSCNGTGACGSLFGNGAACTNGTECQTGHCVDGVCCDTACTGVCVSCNAAATKGTCTNFAAGTDPNDAECPGAALACSGAGACKKIAAQTCASDAECISGHCADGVCCDTACTGSCRACNLSGTIGVCTNIPSGQDPANECAGTASCNGACACALLPSGVPCLQNAECQTGACVDGVCCSDPCLGTCRACSAAKTGQIDGVCGNIITNTDPDNECPGTASCNGLGACQQPNGAPCTMALQCQSGFCADGFCCDTACTGTCMACSLSKKQQGTNGTCGPILNGADPDNECVNQGSGSCGTDGFCDGAGACRKYPGGKFSTGTDESTGGTVDGAPAIGDVNGDGKPDIVVALASSNQISVLINTGNGTFNNGLTYPSGPVLGPPVLADVNGDGKLDVVLVGQSSSNVYVLLNNGNGAFNNQNQYFASGTLQAPPVVADVNGDGKPDIVLAGQNSSNVYVLLNDGNGAFNNQNQYFAGGNVQTPLSVADVTGDGKPDIIAAYTSGSYITVLTNDGTGSFNNQNQYYAGGNVDAPLSIADVTGDGKPDIVAVYPGAGQITVLTNNGTGSFNNQNSYQAGSNLRAPAALADLDGDGKPDVVVGSSSGSNVFVLLNNGTGAFTNSNSYYAGGTYLVPISVADVSGDGYADIVVLRNNSLSVLTNDGSGSFLAQIQYPTGGAYVAPPVLADLNGDGRPDVVLASQLNSYVHVMLNSCQ
jgi:hypothetical protein